MCQALCREISTSWKRAFLLISVALFVYFFLVFEFVSSSLASGEGLRWVYHRLLNVPTDVRTMDNRISSTTGFPDQTPEVPAIQGQRSNDTIHCANIKIGIPLEGGIVDYLPLGDTFAWQRVNGRFYETYTFSAYYDDRQGSARVVILGVSDEYILRESVGPGREFCQVWYPGEAGFDVVEAEFSYVPEHHDLRWVVHTFQQ